MSTQRPNQQLSAYHQASIDGLSPRDLLIRMMQGIERFLRLSQIAMRNREIENAHINCQRANAIISELMLTLNRDQGGDIAVRLNALYIFLQQTITEANLKKAPELIDSILPTIASLREAWEGIPDEFAHVSSVKQTSGTAVTMSVSI
ncbi:MAG: flagellar export chaperone FliS [Planctomycetota bacterium]